MVDKRLLDIEQKIYEAQASVMLYEMKLSNATDRETSDYYSRKLSKAKVTYWSLIKKRDKLKKKIKNRR